MVFGKVRDSRLITVRRGGALQDADHRRLALWAADCAEHVLVLFERRNRMTTARAGRLRPLVPGRGVRFR